MKLEVYCHDSNPDVLTSAKPKARYLMIGSLWLPAEFRDDLKASIKVLRAKHDAWGEIKWTKVSPSKLEFYLDLIDLFVCSEDMLRFKCIALDHQWASKQLHGADDDLGIYGFFYQALHHWILDSNTHRIFCDRKSSGEPWRFAHMQRALDNADLSANVEGVHALQSKEVVLIQFTNLLLGAAGSRVNGKLAEGTAKETVAKALENGVPFAHVHRAGQGESRFDILTISQEDDRQ